MLQQPHLVGEYQVAHLGGEEQLLQLFENPCLGRTHHEHGPWGSDGLDHLAEDQLVQLGLLGQDDVVWTWGQSALPFRQKQQQNLLEEQQLQLFPQHKPQFFWHDVAGERVQVAFVEDEEVVQGEAEDEPTPSMSFKVKTSIIFSFPDNEICRSNFFPPSFLIPPCFSTQADAQCR